MNIQSGVYRLPVKGGRFDVVIGDGDYPGVAVEFISDAEEKYFDTHSEDDPYTSPRIRFELEDGKLHALIWGDSTQEDYTEEVSFNGFHEPPKTEETE